MPSPNKITLKAYLAPEEYENIKTAAAQARLSVSRYARAVCLGYEPKSKVDHEAVLALAQTNHDLSRLGNLLKLAIDQGVISEENVSDLIDSIKKTKSDLDEKVRRI